MDCNWHRTLVPNHTRPRFFPWIFFFTNLCFFFRFFFKVVLRPSFFFTKKKKKKRKRLFVLRCCTNPNRKKKQPMPRQIEDPIRVYISGGPHRQRFSNGLTQSQMEDAITDRFPNVQIVKSGATKYIIIDDENSEGPSNTALKTGGEIVTYQEFLNKMQRRKASLKKKSSKKKKTHSMRGCAETAEAKEETDGMVEDMSQLSVTDESSAVIVFAKYASYLYMFVSQKISAEDFMVFMKTVTADMTRVLANGSPKQATLQQNWLQYCKTIVDIQAKMAAKKQPCSAAIDAQRMLGTKSNAIIASLVDRVQDLEKLLNFFTEHDEFVVQLMLAIENKADTMSTFDLLLTSMLRFATMK